MLGQKKNIKEIERLKNIFPRFSILAGPMGSGKKMLARHIAKEIGAQAVMCDISVAAVRDIIKASYKQKEPTVYILPDTDKMSISAKNALLKVTEEPPREAYFIMTVENTSNTLNTLVSRGTVFRMEPYAGPDMVIYLGNQPDYDILADEELNRMILDICVVPGDINRLFSGVGADNIEEYFKYINLVIDNIGTAAGSNVFKIGNKLAFKADSDLWDVEMFLRALRAVCVRRLDEEKDLLYVGYIQVTSSALQELSIKGIHKQSSFDMWILNMRTVYRLGGPIASS